MYPYYLGIFTYWILLVQTEDRRIPTNDTNVRHVRRHFFGSVQAAAFVPFQPSRWRGAFLPGPIQGFNGGCGC